MQATTFSTREGTEIRSGDTLEREDGPNFWIVERTLYVETEMREAVELCRDGGSAFNIYAHFRIRGSEGRVLFDPFSK